MDAGQPRELERQVGGTLNDRDRERLEELRRVPLQNIDKSKWPKDVRPISVSETGGLGIDQTGRLHWNGKPIEIVGQRLDLTWPQFFIALVVAVAIIVAAVATSVQAWTAYHDWACKVGWPVYAKCGPERPVVIRAAPSSEKP
jgi:hypothetical protein